MQDYWMLSKDTRKRVNKQIERLRESLITHQTKLQYHKNMAKHHEHAIATERLELDRVYEKFGITCPAP